ncbi:MAG: hypothetical protein JKX92_10420 [Porticoccaceae bacterium]|nr:hypothetical protein [Porticoccaceae bacterium]
MKLCVKIVSVLILLVMFSSCAVVGDYYVLTNEKDGKSYSRLYSGEIFVYVSHFDGNFSSFDVYKRNKKRELNVELLGYEHSLSINNIIQAPDTTRDNMKIPSRAPSETLLFSFTEVYKFTVPPESVTETINIKLLVNKVPVIFSQEFPLKRVTYNQLQAVWAI